MVDAMSARSVLFNGYGRAHGPVLSVMADDPSAFVENLDNRRRKTHIHQLTHELIRNAVEAAFEVDVVVDVYPRLLALRCFPPT